MSIRNTVSYRGLTSVVAWLPESSWRDASWRRGHPGYPEYMRDLIRILNKFSIKIYLTGLPQPLRGFAMTGFFKPRNNAELE